MNALSKSIGTAVTRSDRGAVLTREPQICDNPELFWSDQMWEKTLDVGSPRSTRLSAIVSNLIAMDLTHPSPQCKQRLVGMLGLTDDWIGDNATNAKVALGELTEALRKARPSPQNFKRPHLVNSPRDPTTACEVIEGFAERVYGDTTPALDPPYTTELIDAAVRNTVLRWANRSVRDSAPAAAANLADGSDVALRRTPTLHVNLGGATAPGAPTPQNMQQFQHQHMMQVKSMISMRAIILILFQIGLLELGQFIMSGQEVFLTV